MLNKLKGVIRKNPDPETEDKIVKIPHGKLMSQNMEVKHYDRYDNIFDVFSASGFTQINSFQSIRYYDNIAPLATGIDIITDELSTIKPKYFQGKNNFVESPALDLLRHPNADQTFLEFFKQYSTYYKITGNTFIVATGNINQPPLEIYITPPQYVTSVEGTDGYAEYYQVSLSYNTSITETFYRIEENGRFRFVNQDETRELWHVKNFNAMADNNFGKPILLPIFYEIEQYLQASVHNLSLLQKGGRLSGALVSKGPLTDEQFARAQEQIENTFAGARNAGRIMIGEGDMDFKEMSSNMKDMDFRNLKRDDAIAIYNRLRIPLALVIPELMTMNNYAQSRLGLYDNAVLPDARKLYGELTLFLSFRYGWNIAEEGLTFDETDIQALQLRRNEEVKLRKEIGVNEVDEMRMLLGDDPLPNGIGRTVLISTSQRDLGSEEVATSTENSETDISTMSRERFLDITKNMDKDDEMIDKAIEMMEDGFDLCQ